MARLFLRFVGFIALWAMSFSGAWAQGTGYPYSPMTNGKSITYAVMRITGLWYPADMKLDVTWRSANTGNQTIAFSPSTCALFGSGPLYRATYNGTGSLQDGGWVVSGKDYLGEAINESSQVAVPFIALLTKTPVIGEQLSATSNITTSCTDNTLIETLPWTYKTLDYYATWGVFTDVWRTGLLEKHSEARQANGSLFPGAQNRVYNYVFQNGVGLVNFWFGYLQPDGTLYYNATNPNDPKNGYEYYAISHN